jgi:hypothetical protein
MPSRAGKTRKLRDEGLAREVSVAA